LFDKRTLQTLRSAEFGFFGVIVLTCKITPLLKGDGFSEKRLSLALNQRLKAPFLDFFTILFLPFLTS